MILLSNLKMVTKDKYEVKGRHYMPFDEKNGLGKTREQLELEGVFVHSIPEPQQVDGKSVILYCNPATKELWYEYEDIPKTSEQIQQEKIDELKSQSESQDQAIAELSMTIATPTV